MAASIAISILAYNEEATIEAVISESLAVLKRCADDFEVLVIDDGSTDQTGLKADRLAQQDPHIRVVHHPKNLGFGQTMQEVWKIPQKDWIFFVPGDGQIPPSELETLWAWHDRADFILGWRKERQDPWVRRLLAFLYNVLIRLIAGQRIHDVDSVVLVRKALLDRMRLESNSPFIHAECLLEACRLKASVAELPIKHVARSAGQARGARFIYIVKTFQDLLHYLKRR